jgi:hypothetical protein
MADTMPTGALIGLDEETLLEIRDNAVNHLNGAFKTGQSYSRPGFSFTKMTPAEIKATLREVEYALAQLRGTFVNTTYMDHSDDLAEVGGVPRRDSY